MSPHDAGRALQLWWNAALGFVPKVLSLAGKAGLRAILRRIARASKDFEHDGAIVTEHWPPYSLETLEAPLSAQAAEIFRSVAYHSDSDCCEKMRAESKVPGAAVYFVNGIVTTLDQHCHAVDLIARATCQPALGIYNGTRGFVIDALDLQAELENIELARLGRNPAEPSPAISVLRDVMLGELEASPAVEVWAHSEGGAIASAALYRVRNILALSLDLGLLSKISVRTFGSAAPVWPSGPDYLHFVHARDFTPNVFGIRERGEASIRRFGSPGSYDLSACHGFEDVYLEEYRRQRRSCNGAEVS